MKRRLSIAAIAILACTFDPSVEAIDLNDRDLTGSWHMPGFAGQGLQIEVYPNVVAPGVGFLQGSWATFEPFVYPYTSYYPNPIWFTFSGEVRAGQTSQQFSVWENDPGNFNAPPATSARQIGTASISLIDCNTADIEYDVGRDSSTVGSRSS